MHTRVAVLALVFGDATALGSSGLLRDAPQTRLDEFAPGALCELVGSQFSGVQRPWLHFDVERLVVSCGGDPLTLLWESEPELPDGDQDKAYFPLSAFRRGDLARGGVGFEVADVHLHSGASIPLEIFFSALASRRTALAHSELRGRTLLLPSGQEWDFHTLLMSLRWALRLLRVVRDGVDLNDLHHLAELNFDLDIVESVAAGSYWSQVHLACAGDVKMRATLHPGMARRFEDGSLCDFADLLWRTATLPSYDFPGRQGFLYGVIRAVVSVARQVNARPGEGLSRFGDRFELMGLTRDASLGELKTKSIWWTLRQTARSPDVIGAEFRKTITGEERRTFRRKILDALWDHGCAFEAFAYEHGRAMALATPIGFHRRPAHGRGGDWTDMAQLGDVLTGTAVLAELCESDAALMERTISSIDVAGDEYGSASWPYSVGAAILARRGVNLRYTIHAGESFATPLNGIRRVGELLLGDRKPDRVGHALSLCRATAARICAGRAPPQRIGDVVIDAAWTLVAGFGDGDAAEGVLYDLVKALPGHGAIRTKNWTEAYEMLWSMEELLRVGVVEEIMPGTYAPAADETLRALGRSRSATTRALIALCSGAGPDVAGCDVTALVPRNLLHGVAEHSDRQADAARTFVQEKLGDEARPVVIESCPTSNVRLAGITSAGEHPLWNWKRDGLTVVIGSDDPVIFGSTIVDEFETLLTVSADRAVVDELAVASVRCCGSERWRANDFGAVLDHLEQWMPAARRAQRQRF